MDVQELQVPDDYTPTPSVRYNVLSVEPRFEDWNVQTREVGWDQYGIEISAPSRDQTLDSKRLDRLKQIWQAQGYILVAQYKSDLDEVLYYEYRGDQERLEAQTSTTLPEALEVWIRANHERAFTCVVPKTLAFSTRTADQLAERDIGHTDVPVSERRGSLIASVYWMNGQPSAEAQARWQPIIEWKVRAYLQTSLSQSRNSFVKGIIEDSVRQGDDARDLIMAGVDLQQRLAELKALDYQPVATDLP